MAENLFNWVMCGQHQFSERHRERATRHGAQGHRRAARPRIVVQSIAHQGGANGRHKYTDLPPPYQGCRDTCHPGEGCGSPLLRGTAWLQQ
jgi:hypothetical protein